MPETPWSLWDCYPLPLAMAGATAGPADNWDDLFYWGGPMCMVMPAEPGTGPSPGVKLIAEGFLGPKT